MTLAVDRRDDLIALASALIRFDTSAGDPAGPTCVDARLGTPCVAFGPGEIDRAHPVDEHVPVDDLVARAPALAVAALRFAGERR